MYRNSLVPISLSVLIVLSSSLMRADDTAQATTESRLRDALRSTAQQLQDAQGQTATLQAAQAQSDKDNADLKTKVDVLTAQIASLTKQSADDKGASNKAIADLKAQSDDEVTQISKLNDAITAWEKDDKQYRQISQDKEAQCAQLTAQEILMQRVIDDRETKNMALYNLANEILTRYEKYGLGEALTAKEPFTGVTRVKLQELVQDYRDKVSNQLVTPGQPPTIPPPAAITQKPAGTQTGAAGKKAAGQQPSA
jgi:hypothetical protein